MSEFARSLAVVIGINKYHNGIASLETAVPDAIAIAEILQNSYQYRLIHSRFDSGVIIDSYGTQKDIKSLFSNLLPNTIKVNQRDRVLIYFAGHGIARSSDKGLEGYLVPQDGDINNLDSLIRMGDLNQWLSQLKCRHLLVILDCCFAGSFRWASTRKLIPIPLTIHWEHYHRFIKYPAWQVITSAAHNQEALDFLNNRDIEKDSQHSPFAAGLIKALGENQADLIADGVITTPELYLYLRDYVEQNSDERQTPGFFPLSKHDRGEYIFKLPNIEPKLKPAPKLDKENNPYRGLESFEPRHSQFFFGRQEVIEDLYRRVTSTAQLTVVLGISGSGKSSLVKAGLIPFLRAKQGAKWQILAPMRPGVDAYAALGRVFDGELGEWGNGDFIFLIESWCEQHPKKRLLLVIDQFEELISRVGIAHQVDNTAIDNQELAKNEPGQEFIQLLAQIIQNYPQFSLIITLRSDFEPRFLDTALKPYWANSRFVVRGMRPDELREVVEKPATEMALYFEPTNLVDRLVDEVAQLPGALPLLSFTLSEMYIKLHRAWLEEGQQERALTVDADFERQGGVAGSLTRRANEEYNNLPDDLHRETMRRVMLRMVDIQGGEAIKRRVLKPELIYPDVAENQRVERVLDSLIATRLIVTGKESESDAIYYEPAHDFLVRGWDKLQDWLQQGEQQDNLVLQRLLTPAAFDWQNKAKFRRFLWNANPRLDLLKEILNSDANWFNAVEKEFVTSSIARKKLNSRWRWGIAIAVMVFLSTGLVIALLGQRNAKIGQSNAAKQSARNSLNANNSLDAMVDSLEAGKNLQHPLLTWFKPSLQLQEQVTGTLQWSFYEVKELNRMQGDTVPVRSVFSPQGDLIASGEESGMIRLWDLTGKELFVWQGDRERVWGVTFSPQGDIFASSSDTGIISLWSREGKELAYWQAHPSSFRSIGFSSDGQTIATAGWEDGTVALWNLQGKLLTRWQADSDRVKSVTFSPDDELIVTVNGDKTIRVWSLQGRLRRTFFVHSWRVVFSPDGKFFASAGDDGVIKIWNRNYDLIASPQADEQRLWNIAFSPDSKLIASAGEDGSARLWNLQGEQIAEFKSHASPVRSVSFSQNGKLLLSSGDDGTTRIWNLAEGNTDSWQADRYPVNEIAFSPDGKSIASGGKSGLISLWNVKNKQKEPITRHKSPINTIAFSPDNQLIASGSQDGTVRIWNRQTKSAQTITTNTDSVTAMVFHPDSKHLAIARSNGTIEIWNLQSELISKLTAHQGIVSDLSFSPDGKLLASVGEDSLVKTWDFHQRKPLKTFSSHVGEVYTVAFSPDGKWLISGGEDSTIRRWNLETNSTQSPLHVYRASINSVTFTPDSKTIISTSDNGFIQLWHSQTGELLATWQAEESEINSMSLNPAGKVITTVGESNKIKLWQIDSFEQLMTQTCNLMQNYLQNNSTIGDRDRLFCDKFF